MEAMQAVTACACELAGASCWRLFCGCQLTSSTFRAGYGFWATALTSWQESGAGAERLRSVNGFARDFRRLTATAKNALYPFCPIFDPFDVDAMLVNGVDPGLT